MSVVPEIDCVIDIDVCMIDVGEKAHDANKLSMIELCEDFVWDGEGLPLLKGRQRRGTREWRSGIDSEQESQSMRQGADAAESACRKMT